MSAEAKHTPTPWTWAWRDDDEQAPGSIFAMPSPGHAYAIAMCPRYGRERFAADAAHVVRCVNSHYELVAALRGMVREFGYDVVHTNGLVHDERQAINKAMDALAKAEGRTT